METALSRVSIFIIFPMATINPETNTVANGLHRTSKWGIPMAIGSNPAIVDTVVIKIGLNRS